MATATAKAIEGEVKDDLEEFCKKHRDAGAQREVTIGRFGFLETNNKIQVGPIRGQTKKEGRTIKVCFARTKRTGDNPNGEIIYAIPRKG